MRFRSLISLLLLLTACSMPVESIQEMKLTATPAHAASTPVVSPTVEMLVETVSPEVAPTATLVDLKDMAQWGKGGILQAVYSPDGQRLGVVALPGVYLYDADTLEQLDFIPNGGGWASAAFAPDWSALALGKDSAARLLRLSDQVEVAHFETQQGRITRLFYSPDGQYLACLVRPPGEEVYNAIVELRRAADGELLKTWAVGVMPDVTFSADSQAFFAWNPSRMDRVMGWQIPSGESLKLEGYRSFDVMAFSPDGKLRVDFNDANDLLLRWVADGTAVRTLAGKNLRSPIQFSPDGALIAAFTADQTVLVWRVADGALLHTLPARGGLSALFAFSPDHQTLAVPAWDGLDFYRLPDSRLVRHLGEHYNRINPAVLSPGGDQVAALTMEQNAQAGLVVWQAADGRVVFHKAGTPALTLAWSPDGAHLALGGWGGTISILRAADGQEALTWSAHSEQVQSLAYSPDGQLLASSSMSAVSIWQASDGALVRRLTLPGGWSTSLRFSQDGRRLAALTGDGNVIIWQVPASPGGDWQELGQFPTSNYGNDGILDFTPDGEMLAIGEPVVADASSNIWLWRVEEQKTLTHIKLQQATLTSLRLSPDGSLLVGSFTDGILRFWHIPDGKPLRALESGTAGITSLDFSADGRTLLSATSDGTIHLWEVP